MKEYVEREYLENMVDYYLGHSNGAEHYAYGIIRGEVRCAPAANVSEVKYGTWLKGWCDNNMIGHEYEECSVCGCSMLDTNQFWDSKFCPNCGASMNGECNE